MSYYSKASEKSSFVMSNTLKTMMKSMDNRNQNNFAGERKNTEDYGILTPNDQQE